ncbi:plasmid mobilization relaxosome protein MobC [uncultured Mobiluncus sp.]|uniref:plasmid mobilization relaxosome protein MobC n=1 Tax=uncultured Mobiluncus sp. TaxID=293425 RepID=UPI002614BEA3|nr:plasmid mobilization relaxosome protein MobC [uncultured Mobiluncus sp.]
MRAGNRVDVRLGEKLAREVTAWAEAHDASVSETLRLLITIGLRSGEPVREHERKSVPPVNQEAVRQLTRVGVNLNQVTRKINRSGALDFDLMRLRDEVASTTELVREAVRVLGVHDDTEG